jgi:hypothetical protein
VTDVEECHFLGCGVIIIIIIIIIIINPRLNVKTPNPRKRSFSKNQSEVCLVKNT